MYVANESMMTAAGTGKTEYKLEDGHFALTEKAEDALLSAIRSGEKADVKAYYTARQKRSWTRNLKRNSPRNSMQKFERI